jgi:murein DD-endopeptidase MepM/ murein hydrolase activator NlpD
MMFKSAFAKLFRPGACLSSFLPVLLLAALCVRPAEGKTSNPGPESSTVTVTTRRDGDVTHFYVENKEFCEVTMTFEMGLINLKGDSKFPYTATFPARQTSEAFAVSPVKSGSEWGYSYTNYYKLGSNCAKHDDSYAYQLPYGPERNFKVTQAFNGKFSHKGSNRYAIDWQMPEGTPVRAARGGIVVKVKDDSTSGGSSMKFDCFNNYVLIRHEDGTLGHYCHLQHDGVNVSVGQSVATGDVIAHSGNTGFSSGPHLHFCVFRTLDGRERVSIPIKFQTASEKEVVLLSGKTYRPSPALNSVTLSKVGAPHVGAASPP